ncbi:hypothetical protein GLOTRDRAFT_132183 [Gloeophyllum trabeum ATCC 11539]|uniref:Protein kinase domain-containing protein n=1 Tax=Gloeophyllum trabeum (strain ATCC 11539 / FP-39264 / Madison 617) TaxID=670483 RepID=S7RHI8_GLOTA|nr:uncharacterized protein GLOTRDRAFT_132183 [Gloeophyllum trabeum ATCC 11539]EPQ52059.1 hypothetical protein GLOTRDRAFT_132183 [Gloeophyllum trabeum ATCC 11539]
MARLIWNVQYPRSHSEYIGLLDEFRRRQTASLESPLKQDHNLHFVGSPNFDFLPHPAYQVNQTSYLGQVLAPLNETARDAYAPHHRRRYVIELRLDGRSLPEFEVILRQPLSTGLEKFAQVWKADAICRDGTVFPVVAKLFQGSLFPEPQWLEYDNVLDEDYPLQEEVSHREAWAYERLRSARGTIIPYSYGFYDVQLPCGSVACTHIIEYIDGVTPGTYCKMYGGQANQEQTHKFMTTLTKSVYALHCLGVAHYDISWRNVLVPKIHLGSAVMFDFGRAMSLSSEVESPEDWIEPLLKDGKGLYGVLSIVTSQRQMEVWADEVRADPGTLWARPLRDARELPYEGRVGPVYHDDRLRYLCDIPSAEQ